MFLFDTLEVCVSFMSLFSGGCHELLVIAAKGGWTAYVLLDTNCMSCFSWNAVFKKKILCYIGQIQVQHINN